MKLILRNTSLKFERPATEVVLTPTDTVSTGVFGDSNISGNIKPAGGAEVLKFYNVAQYAGETLHVKSVLRENDDSDVTIASFYATAVTSASANENGFILCDMPDGSKIATTNGFSKKAGYNGSQYNYLVDGEVDIPNGAVTMVIRAGSLSSIGTSPSNPLNDMKVYTYDN